MTYFQVSPVFCQSHSPRSARFPTVAPATVASYFLSNFRSVKVCVVKMQSSLFFKQIVHTTVYIVNQKDVLIRMLFAGLNKNPLHFKTRKIIVFGCSDLVRFMIMSSQVKLEIPEVSKGLAIVEYQIFEGHCFWCSLPYIFTQSI